jgi:hypothetical protein
MKKYNNAIKQPQRTRILDPANKEIYYKGIKGSRWAFHIPVRTSKTI